MANSQEEKGTVVEFSTDSGSRGRVIISGSRVHVEGATIVTVDLVTGPTGGGFNQWPIPEKEEIGIIGVEINGFWPELIGIGVAGHSARELLPMSQVPGLQIRRVADDEPAGRQITISSRETSGRSIPVEGCMPWPTTQPQKP